MTRFVLNAAFSLPDFLTSGTAIMIYVAVILAAIVVLMISFIVKESGSKATKYEFVGNINAVTDMQAVQRPQDPRDTDGSPETVTGGTERFCMLSDIERKKSTIGKVTYDKDVTLEQFCTDFRNYAASNL